MKCQICNQEFTNQGFTYHLTHSHNMSAKKYYDTYISKDNKCKNCGKESQFISLSKGYHKLCRDCINQSPKMICRLCGQETNALGMPSHLQKHKYNTKMYYDQFLKEGVCRICGKPTKFINISSGYEKTCSRKCQYEYQKDPECLAIMNKTCQAKYGTNYHFQSNNFKEKAKQSSIEKYGVENPAQSELVKTKIKETNLKRYGVPIPNQFNNDICKKKYEERTKSQAIKTLEKSEQTRKQNKKIDDRLDENNL